MARRQKRGIYSIEDRRAILEAAISEVAGNTVGEKQAWLMLKGIHRPGVPNEPVSESAINYWKNAHRKLTLINRDMYDTTMEKLLNSPPSYRSLKQGFPLLVSGSKDTDNE